MVIKWLIAVVLCVFAAACAGLTGMFFEESRNQLAQGKVKVSAKYTAQSMVMTLVALVMVYIAIRLTQR